MNFRDKVALITGAGSGVGEHLARGLLEKGARVILVGRRKEKLDRVIAMSGNPENAMAISADVTQLDQVERLTQEVLDKYGRIDVLVNNAGTSVSGAVDEITCSDAEYVTKLNLIAPIWLTQLTLPTLKKQPAAMIVNVASIAALVAVPYQSFYCSTKHGLRGFSESLRRELAGSPVKVLTVYPGTFASEIINEDVQRKMAEEGMGRLGGVMSAEVVATRMLRAMEKNKKNLILAGKERMMVKLERWAPRLLDRLLRRMAPRIRKIMAEVNKRARQSIDVSKHR